MKRMKRMKKVTNWLYNCALELPVWALCTVMVVSAGATLIAGLLGMLFILASVTENVIVLSDFTIGFVLTIFSLVLLYFALSIIGAFFDRVAQTEIENSKKNKAKSKEEVHGRKARK